MDMKNDTCVYLHRRLDTNEVFYVGIGNDKRPRSKDGRSKWWHNTVNKHGYEAEVIEENLSWDSACLIEIALIDFFGRKDLGKGALVNLTNGGDGVNGCICSEETRAKIGAAHKGKKHSAESKAKMSAAKKGRKLSAEHKAKIGAAKKGRKLSAEHKAKMSKAKKGRKHSAESKAKMSKAKKGKKTSAETKAKLSASQAGEKAHNAKLTEEIVIEILYQLKFHYYLGMVNDLAKKYGVSPTSISEIKNNRTWKHIDRNLIIKKT